MHAVRRELDSFQAAQISLRTDVGMLASTLAERIVGEQLSDTALSERVIDCISRQDFVMSASSIQAFIPLMQPLRWSLVKPQLTGWRPSAFATHPLHHLRERR